MSTGANTNQVPDKLYNIYLQDYASHDDTPAEDKKLLVDLTSLLFVKTFQIKLYTTKQNSYHAKNLKFLQ